MMIERFRLQEKFDSLKFRRTYINGSKKNEKKLEKDLMGKKDEEGLYPDCDWLMAREFAIKHFTDKEHIAFSYRTRLKEIFYLFAFTTLIGLAGYNLMTLLPKIVFLISISVGSLSFLGYVGFTIYQGRMNLNLRSLVALSTIILNEKYGINPSIK